MIRRLSINTKAQVEFQNITGLVQEVVSTSGIKNGLCHIFVPHTTAAITVNEQADPNVVEDIMSQLDALVPHRVSYRHSEGNAAAHIKASLVGNFQTVIVENGRLVLGTWQGIFFCEFDGPRSRSAVVKVVPD